VKSWRNLVLTALLASALSVMVVYALLASVTIHNIATLKNVGLEVYADQQLTQPLTQINWGTLQLGETKSYLAYVKNPSNVQVTLAVWTQNWNPNGTQNYVTLNCNLAGIMMQPSQVSPCNFTLHVASNTQGVSSFSFDIIMQAEG
jgi:hypothetical protein